MWLSSGQCVVNILIKGKGMLSLPLSPCVGQELVNYSLWAKSGLPSIFINRFIRTQPYSCVYILSRELLCYNGRIEYLQWDHMFQNAKNIYDPALSKRANPWLRKINLIATFLDHEIKGNTPGMMAEQQVRKSWAQRLCGAQSLYQLGLLDEKHISTLF